MFGYIWTGASAPLKRCGPGGTYNLYDRRISLPTDNKQRGETLQDIVGKTYVVKRWGGSADVTGGERDATIQSMWLSL